MAILDDGDPCYRTILLNDAPERGSAMKCLRIYSTPDGESHFDEVDLPMTASLTVAPGAKPFQVSAAYGATKVRFTRIPAGMRQVEWHTVPARVLTVRLTGAVDYETSDGEIRHVSAGEFVLVEDLHGKGHLSRHSPEEQTVLWITLPDGLDSPLDELDGRSPTKIRSSPGTLTQAD